MIIFPLSLRVCCRFNTIITIKRKSRRYFVYTSIVTSHGQPMHAKRQPVSLRTRPLYDCGRRGRRRALRTCPPACAPPPPPSWTLCEPNYRGSVCSVPYRLPFARTCTACRKKCVPLYSTRYATNYCNYLRLSF